MELKYHKLVVINTIISSSNRTFMELKYFLGEISSQEDIKVLIAPLWN